MTQSAPHSRADMHPVWVYLIGLAVVAIGGVLVGVWLDWLPLYWEEVLGLSLWFGGLCIVTAAGLSSRLRDPIV